MKMRIIPVVRALVVKDDKILLGKREMNDGFLPGYWTIPGGKVEPGERLLNALKREMKEETNLDVERAELVKVDEQFHDDHHHIIFYFRTHVSGNPKPGSELDDISWFRGSELKNLEMLERDKKLISGLLEVLLKGRDNY